MKLFLSAVCLFLLIVCQNVSGQSAHFDKDGFFNDTFPINAVLVSNMAKIYNYRGKTDVDYPAIFKTTLPDSTEVKDKIILNVRGHFRQGYCFVPPIKLIFNYNKGSKFYSLKSLKLVNTCRISNEYDQYLLKEYIIYKIYNLITDMSFRVRLLNLDLVDSAGKKKMISEHAFLLEDIKTLAERNNCRDLKDMKFNTESTDRRQMTIVAIFEYMIGNTDWAVSVNHNTRLISPVNEPQSRPFVVPYDFDYSGFVNTSYAFPDEKLEIESVRQRLYRGFPRSLPEVEEVAAIFKAKKEGIYSLINNFDLLTRANKLEMTGYLDGFYSIINDPQMLKYTFIDNARFQ